MRMLDDYGRGLVERRLSQMFVERNNRIRQINSDYERERKRLEEMLASGIIPQTIG